MQYIVIKAKQLFSRKVLPTLNSHHTFATDKEKTTLDRAVFVFVVEVMGVEPTSYSAAKKLSTYLVASTILTDPPRANTL